MRKSLRWKARREVAATLAKLKGEITRKEEQLQILRRQFATLRHAHALLIRR